MRWIGTIFAVCCVATVLSEIMGAALLWSRGQLTSETLTEIRDVLAGTNQADLPDDDDENDKRQPSVDAVTTQRAMRVLKFSTREEELRMLTRSLAEARASLLAQRQEFEQAKSAFHEELKAQQDRLAEESVEQGRAVLAKLSSEDAVGYLMSSELEENVLLLKGMSEKVIAKILDEFADPNGGIERVERGREIFEAIHRGDPTKAVVDAAAQRLAAGANAPANQNQ